MNKNLKLKSLTKSLLGRPIPSILNESLRNSLARRIRSSADIPVESLRISLRVTLRGTFLNELYKTLDTSLCKAMHLYLLDYLRKI